MNSDSLGQNLSFFVRKLSVIDMEFSDFFDMLWTYLGNPDESKDNKGRPKFFCHLIDLIIRTPQTDVEDEKVQSGDLNPFADRVADTINKYCIGSRPIPKKDAKELLSRISNGKKFVDEINFSAPGARESIRNKLREEQFEVTTSSLGEVCFKIMKAFLNKFKNGETSVKTNDVKTNQNFIDNLRLLHDVDIECPLCGESLIKNGISNAIAGYDVVHIFPDNLNEKEKAKFAKIKKAPENSDALENKIPLCLNCANVYLNNPNLNDYQRLIQKKQHIINEKQIAQGLNQLTLEAKLTKVIQGLKKVKPNLANSVIDYDAHTVEEKISHDYALQGAVSYYVSGYYNKIKDQFSNLEGPDFSFDELATTIKLAYFKFKREQLDQEEIFNHLADWILTKEQLPQDYSEASRIIVAFFVQNCEVFEVENAQ